MAGQQAAPASRPARQGPWRVFEVPVLRRLLVAFGISKIGDVLYATALVVVVLQRTGSAGWVSAIVIAHFSPNALVTPFAGVLADRMDRLRLMVLSDTVRLALMVAATLLVAVEAPLVVLVVVAFLAASAGTPFGSSLLASLPELVEEDRLPSANAAIQALMQVGALAGAVLATVILRAGVPWLPFAVNAVTFALSAATLTSLRAARRPRTVAAQPAEPAEPAATVARESFGEAFAAGLRILRSNRFLKIVAVVLVPVSFGWGVRPILLPLVSRDLLGTGEAGVGLLTAAAGLGGVLGAGVAARAASGDRLLAMLSLTGLGTVLPMGVLSLVHAPAVAYVVLLAEGVATMAIEVVWMTALQRILPLDQVARIDGLFISLCFAMMTLGNLLAPVMASVLGLRTALWTTTAIGAVGAVAGLALGAGVLLRRPEGDVTRALRGVLALQGLGEPGYEALARAASAPQWVPAGTVLLTAGDAATEVLLLVEGGADVLATSRDGVPLPDPVLVAHVTAPDVLGELGVIGRRSRTASVVTTSDAVVRRVPADAFVAAVAPPSGLPGLPGEALPTSLGITVHARLGRWAG